MSEVSRELLIRLPVDQEVYAEQVASGDVVQDATVATEIVAFDQDRDTYQLEGAIVFAAYVQKASSGDVVHVHQRLPFLLRVPSSAQQAGVLNVKSRLAGVQLDVSGEAWLHLGGWLEVHGLNGSQGYLFRCGAQEVQETFPAEEIAGPAGDVAFQAADVAPEPALRAEAQEETGDPGVPEKPTVEVVSEARGGAQAADGSAESAGEVPPSAQHHLAEFDRFFPQTGSADVENLGAELDGVDRSDVVSAPAAQTPVASFEFVHQVDDAMVDDAVVDHAMVDDAMVDDAMVDDAMVDDAVVDDAVVGDAVVGDAVVDDAVVDAASDSRVEDSTPEQRVEAPFDQAVDAQADAQGPSEAPQSLAADQTPKVSFFASTREEAVEATSSQEADRDALPSEVIPEPMLDDLERHEGEAPKPQDKKLWSFVDFNAPEPRHTLRFVIVLEHESLETVAERCGCLPSELERANPWLQGQPEPGMALLVPERRAMIQKVVQLN
ncbi:hypothetical protein IW967_12925 [Alicyclobacillus mali]|uniref:LysM domain-containing protein n=1 Tax=Alicyclobacillus mali (ex Roth et al. 2021) TaxID=1123961 RepID=A0ABS0F641_9BACL|nr:hypothetical protein [Alicyclobacillus mali (ex Roth et al. 2021)]MBF8378759.1 hypothetical protein [Alicyclobacillus mali (ex Roth et al. 2021)]